MLRTIPELLRGLKAGTILLPGDISQKTYLLVEREAEADFRGREASIRKMIHENGITDANPDLWDEVIPPGISAICVWIDQAGSQIDLCSNISCTFDQSDSYTDDEGATFTPGYNIKRGSLFKKLGLGIRDFNESPENRELIFALWDSEAKLRKVNVYGCWNKRQIDQKRAADAWLRIMIRLDHLVDIFDGLGNLK